MKVRQNYNDGLVTLEVNDEPSLTVPDQTISIREMLRRHLQGMPVSGTQVYYDDSPDIDDELHPSQDIDLTDLDDLRDLNKVRMDKVNEEIKKQALDKRQKRKEQRKREFEELKKEFETQE